MAHVDQLDAHQKPPERMRSLFKKYQKCGVKDLLDDAGIIDMVRAVAELYDHPKLLPVPWPADRDRAFQEFLSPSSQNNGKRRAVCISAFEVRNIPGLYVLPNLLHPEVQLVLLERLLHRDLSNHNHRTNVHLHHHISCPPVASPIPVESFFCQNKTATFSPKNPAIHKPITIADFLEKKLRWMTLGGQYDWTAKRYPPEHPPPFPSDIKQLLGRLFPETDPQAAIVNFYAPGDTLSVHRDVSEYCDQGLVSISLGCDGIFIVGNQDGTETAALRLRSGDAVYMTGASRYAWHGVPKIIPATCPHWLSEWPAVGNNEEEYIHWQGWMNNKRINVNVRQMKVLQSSTSEHGKLVMPSR